MWTTFVIYLLLGFQAFLLLVMIILISVMIHAVIYVPWVPTRGKIGKRMFELAQLKPGETVVDFGSPEQCDLQQQILSRQHAKNPGFYAHILAHLETLMHSRAMAA